MITIDEAVLSRLEQFRRKFWTWEELASWYGVSEADRTLLDDTERFGGTVDLPSVFKEGPTPHYNRWHFEVFLQRQELVPVRFVAAELAISIEQLQAVIEHLLADTLPPGINRIPQPRRSPNVLWKNFLRDVHKAFNSMRRTIFANHPAYIRLLHQTIRDELGVAVDTITTPCVENNSDTGQLIDTVRPQYFVDCITDEPVALGGHVYLDFRKPAELALDICSWKTFVQHKGLLADNAFAPKSLTSEIENHIANA